MSGANITYLVFFFIFLAVSHIATMVEIAFVNVPMIRVRHLETSNVPNAATVARIKQNAGRLLSTTSLVNAFSDTIVAAFGTMLFVSALGRGAGSPVGIIVVALVALVVARMTPKLIAAEHAEQISLFFAEPTALVMKLLSRVIRVTSWVPERLARIFGGEPTIATLVSKEELASIISVGEEEGVVEEGEADMLRKAVKFGTRQVREVMTPRTEVTWIEKKAKLADFFDAYCKGPGLRYPVYDGTYDKVVGSISVRDVLLAQAQGTLNRGTSLRKLHRPVYVVPGAKQVGELFTDMQATGHMMAIVVNEFGGTSGVVNMEDLVEEIVGELGEDLVGGKPLFELVSEEGFKVSGALRIEDANEHLGLDIPQGDYQTMAGFVLALLGHLPAEGEEVTHDGLKLVIQKVKDNRIQELMVTWEAEKESGPEAGGEDSERGR